MDVATTYLNGDLEEDIYVQPPEEIKDVQKKNEIWKLKKAMYGLKQSEKAWNDKLDSTLMQLELKKSEVDPYLYYKKDRQDCSSRFMLTIYSSYGEMS